MKTDRVHCFQRGPLLEKQKRHTAEGKTFLPADVLNFETVDRPVAVAEDQAFVVWADVQASDRALMHKLPNYFARLTIENPQIVLTGATGDHHIG